MSSTILRDPRSYHSHFLRQVAGIVEWHHGRKAPWYGPSSDREQVRAKLDPGVAKTQILCFVLAWFPVRRKDQTGEKVAAAAPSADKGIAPGAILAQLALSSGMVVISPSSNLLLFPQLHAAR
jgi:hypothetical protein